MAFQQPKRAGDLRLLKKRIDEALRRHPPARFDPLIADLESAGRVAIFGGMIRELVFHEPRRLSSDLDLVVDGISDRDLARTLNTVGFRKNRFGGYRAALGIWSVDIWRLEDTWALRKGYVKGSDLSDMVNTTFFNWDAVVYRLDRREICIREHYFEELERGLLEINLEPNPNPAGNIARAVRHLLTRHAIWGPRLAKYVFDFGLSNEAMVQATLKYPTVFASPLWISLLRALERHAACDAGEPFRAPSQIPLGLHVGP